MRKLWVGVFVLVALGAAGPSASGYCPWGNRWRGPVVDVVLQHQAAERLCVDRAAPCNTVPLAALETTLRAVLDEFNESAGANVRLRYAGLCYRNILGFRVPCSASYQPLNQIVIRANACAPDGQGDNDDLDNDGFAEHGFAEICTGTDPSSPRVYSSYPGQSGASASVHGVLLHELSHALGFAHPSDCGESGGTSVLNTATTVHLSLYDILNLQSLYGLRVGQSMQVAASTPFDPTAWSGIAATSDGDQALGRFSACDNVVSGGTHVAFAGRSPRQIGLVTQRAPGTTSLTSFVPSYFPDHVVLSSAQPGVACQDFQRLRIFYAEDNALGAQTIRYVESADAGQSWGAVMTADPATTLIHGGVDAAFDPASGQYLYAYRHASRVTTKVASEGSNPHGYERSPPPLPVPGACGPGVSGGDCWRASDTPSVACGDPAALGEFNCLIAWPDVDWYRTLTYAAARVVATPGGGHELVLHSVRSANATVFGTPSLALDGAADFPWRVAYHQGTRTVFTRRKAAGPTSDWQDGGSFVFPGDVVGPALGSSRATGWFPFPRTSIFVTKAP